VRLLWIDSAKVSLQDAAQQHSRVPPLSQDRADGLGDFWRGQARGGNLVEQWLKEMVVLAIDDYDVGLGTREGLAEG
jgi:hypothetical protein